MGQETKSFPLHDIRKARSRFDSSEVDERPAGLSYWVQQSRAKNVQNDLIVYAPRPNGYYASRIVVYSADDNVAELRICDDQGNADPQFLPGIVSLEEALFIGGKLLNSTEE